MHVEIYIFLIYFDASTTFDVLFNTFYSFNFFLKS